MEVKEDNIDENVYNKLQEAEQEMNEIVKRYNKEEILQSMNEIIDN